MDIGVMVFMPGEEHDERGEGTGVLVAERKLIIVNLLILVSDF
jgi:hypothetical protein